MKKIYIDAFTRRKDGRKVGGYTMITPLDYDREEILDALKLARIAYKDLKPFLVEYDIQHALFDYVGREINRVLDRYEEFGDRYLAQKRRLKGG